jgi:CRISPR-associated protein Cmr4
MPQNGRGERVRVKARKEGDKTVLETSDAAWLFGSDDANNSWAGALQFSEGKLLAFPIRSAKGSFAWITCPLMLQRAARDGVLGIKALSDVESNSFSGHDDDAKALFGASGPLALKVKDGSTEKTQIVLEEYTFTHAGDLPNGVGTALRGLLADEVWSEVASRLVILSNGLMSFFTQNACEIAQHVRIDDETGTAAGGALFNQENVPSEALFYAVLQAFDERTVNKPREQRHKADDALKAFEKKVSERGVFQFGGDASTGLGYCTVAFDKKGA